MEPMTPERRAKEIIERYWNISVGNSTSVNFNEKWNGRDKNYILMRVKEYSLEYVDGIIGYLNGFPMDAMRAFMVGENQYWEEVRDEIQKII